MNALASRPFRVRGRGFRRSAAGGTGLDPVQGPKRNWGWNPWDDIKEAGQDIGNAVERGADWAYKEGKHFLTGDPIPPDPVQNGGAIADANAAEGNGPIQIGSYSSNATPYMNAPSPMLMSQNPYANPESLMMNQDLTGTTNDPATQNGQGGNTANGQTDGGWQQWLKDNTGLTVPQLLQIGGAGLSAYAQYQQNANAQKIQQQEFNAQLGLSKNQQAAQLAAAQQRQGLADKAQYMAGQALSNPPTPFKPVDYTAPGGLNNLNQPASGGAAQQLAANAQAASNYQPGMGGVSGATLDQILGGLGYNNPDPYEEGKFQNLWNAIPKAATNQG